MARQGTGAAAGASPASVVSAAAGGEPLRDVLALLGHEALGGGRMLKRLSDVGEELLGGLLGHGGHGQRPGVTSPKAGDAPGTPISSCPSTPTTRSSLASQADDRSPLLAHGRPARTAAATAAAAAVSPRAGAPASS